MRKFLTRPAVIDWLQWSEFPDCDRLDKPDMPQITLLLIAEYKEEFDRLQKENERLRSKARVELFHAILTNIEADGIDGTIAWMRSRLRFENAELDKLLSGETEGEG